MERNGGVARHRERAGPRHRGSVPDPEEPRDVIRVFLVEDHELFASGVRNELGEEFSLVGRASSVAEAVAEIPRAKPDVVLLDVHLPDGNGPEVVEALPDVRFLALSVWDAAEGVIAVIRAGARGYVTKSISPPELAGAIRRVHDGDAVFSPRLAGFVLDAFAGADRPRPSIPRQRTHPPREGGAPLHRPGIRVQGDRARPAYLGQDGRNSCERGAAEATALQ